MNRYTHATMKIRLRRWAKKPDAVGDGEYGYGWVYTTARVDLGIDMQGLFEALGNKAIANKSKKTRILNGLILAEARPVEEKPAAS